MSRSMQYVLSVAVLLMAAAPAVAEQAPSPWWQARMNQDFARVAVVRVHAFERDHLLRDVRVDEVGVSFGQATRAGNWEALGTAPAEPPSRTPAAPIPWVEIERVETPVRATGFGALIGGAAGTLAAIAVAAAGGIEQENIFSDATPALFMAGGAVVGATLGSTQTRWRRYYPPR